MRRLLLILALIIVLAGGAAWAYFTYFSPSLEVSGEPVGGTDLPVAGNNPATPTDGTPTVDVTGQPTQVANRLTQIDKGPVALGAVVFAIGTSTTADMGVSYVARQSGNLFTYRVKEGSVTRTSNKTIPGIQEAFWLPDGSLSFVRYLSGDTHSTINTYALPSNGQGGYFLAQNIASLAVSPPNVLALASGVNGSVGTLERIDGSQPKQVFSSPFSQLRISFLGKNGYLATTKPAATLAGYVFTVNTTGNFERIAGPLNGLVALPSPSGSWVLLSSVNNSTMRMSLLNVATREMIDLPIGTIADKCAWTAKEDAIYCGIPQNPSINAAYPDDWYQGATIFSDKIWKIDVKGRFASLVLDFTKETKGSLDATSLVLDPSAKLLVFRNKIDGSLWDYEL